MKRLKNEGGRRSDHERLRVRPGVRLAVVLSGLLMVGAGVGWRVMERSGEAGGAVQAGTPAPTAAASAARRPGVAAVPSVSPASGVSAASAPSGAVGTRRPWDLPPEKVAEIEKQWCTHGQVAHQQAMAAVDRATPLDFSASQVDISARVQAKLQDVGVQAREAVKQRLMQRWVTQLQARGDLRSRAAAAFLGARIDYGRDSSFHMPVLRALAEGSRDPLVWHLWRQARGSCFDGAPCGPRTLRPWHEIEPENLLAWLPLLRDASEIPESHWAGIRAARYARSYQEDFLGLLLTLVEGETPSLALQEGLALIEHLSQTWPTIGASSPLVDACTSSGPAQSEQRQADCRRAAELLWTAPHPELHDRLASLRMAAANGAGEQAAWKAREAFVRTFTDADYRRFMEMQFRTGGDQQPCDAQPRQRETLKTIARAGEWAAALGPERSARTP